MKNLMKIILVAAGLVWSMAPAVSQCGTWLESPDKDALEEAHVLYRQFVKSEDYDKAFEYWKTAYEGAPAADGRRSSHFVDGRSIYIHKFKQAATEEEKQAYADKIIALFDQQVECYPEEKALTLGLKVYEMFYTLNSPYAINKKACEEACAAAGDNTSYVVFQPYASIAVWQYQKQQMEAEEARNIYDRLNAIADYNIQQNNTYSAYYQQAKDAMNGTFAQIEDQIFDCGYFKAKLEPKYRENPDDTEVLKYIYNKLVAEECGEADPLVQELKIRYEQIVAEENAVKLAAYYAENPGDHGIALYKEGKYTEALEKFEAGIEKEKAGTNDPEKLANYHFYMASVEFRQLSRYGSARENARMAAKLKPGWGQPYMLIGDMYAQTSSSCGKDAFDASLAILAAIDKWAYAKSIDSSVAGDANGKIGRYTDYYPDKGEAFMRKINEGDSVTVPCWIAETVRVRVK